ncbi:MAG: alpha/beta hydrolase [Desulfomonilaceae bacterium]|nr:alpha/beta hydrolase [Desulfomonilaceae bacterium]
MSLAGDALERFIENAIFYPDTFMMYGPSDFDLDFEDIWFETADGVRLHGWMIPADSPEGLMLFCHGNAGNISHRLDNISRLHDINISVFIFDYRGYGRSGGQISEAGLYTDTEAAYEVAHTYARDKGLKLVIFGRSLGGVAAVHVASTNSCSGVILESTFTNLAAMARTHFPLPLVDGLLKHRFNSLGKIRHVKAPLLFFHGDNDEIVPYRYGLELYEAAPKPKEFVSLEGAGHNDTYLVGGRAYFDKLRSFVQSLP